MKKDTELEETLSAKISDPIIITVIKASPDISLRLNDTDNNPINLNVGDKLVWVANYNSQTNTGSLFVYETSTFVLNVINGVPTLSTGDVIKTSSPNSGEVLLARGRYKITAVGGGGGALVFGTSIEPNGYQGCAAGLVDVELNLESAKYTWQSGKRESSIYYADFKLLPPTPSFLKKDDVFIARGGCGSNVISSESSNIINKNFVYKVISNKAPQPSGEAFYGNAGVVFGNYGKGARVVSIVGTTINYNENTNGYFSLVYLGEII